MLNTRVTSSMAIGGVRVRSREYAHYDGDEDKTPMQIILLVYCAFDWLCNIFLYD